MENINKNTVATYAAIVLTTIIGLSLIDALNIRFPVSVVTSARAGELAVIGEGKVEIAPDTAFVDAGISVNNAKTAADAQNTMNGVNNKIIEAMKGLGIKKENIKTSNYSVYPNAVFEGGRDRVSGYNGNATITIKTENLTLVSQIIQKATEAGANQIQGSRFTIEKPEKYRQEAREEAIKNARQEAARLAKSLGIRLGRVVNIVEAGADQPFPMDFKMARAESSGIGGAPAPDIEPGTQTISSTVTLYFEKR